jgi:biotin carboxylase
VLASALAMDKAQSNNIAKAAGIPVAESKVVDRFSIGEKHPMPAPYVVKPVNEGSSFGVVIVKEDRSHPPQIISSSEWRYGDTVMVERYVHGRELTCAVMGDVALGVCVGLALWAIGMPNPTNMMTSSAGNPVSETRSPSASHSACHPPAARSCSCSIAASTTFR